MSEAQATPEDRARALSRRTILSYDETLGLTQISTDDEAIAVVVDAGVAGATGVHWMQAALRRLKAMMTA